MKHFFYFCCFSPRETTENDLELSDHEEEFYYTEVELGPHTSSPPTLSHRDMARPPHEGNTMLKKVGCMHSKSQNGMFHVLPTHI
jgi:hypothetical protein